MAPRLDLSLKDIIGEDRGGRRGRGRGRGTLRGRGATVARGRGASRGRGRAGTQSRMGVARGGIAKPPIGRGRGRRGGSSGVVVVGGRGNDGGRGRGAVRGGTRTPDCLIGETTDIKAAAGYVLGKLREGKSPVVRAIGAANVNTAAKVVCLAHQHLAEESADLYMEVDFPEYSANPNSSCVSLHVFHKKRRTSLARVNNQIFVSADSRPSAVGGFIAHSLREAPLGRVAITACGPHPLTRALKVSAPRTTPREHASCTWQGRARTAASAQACAHPGGIPRASLPRRWRRRLRGRAGVWRVQGRTQGGQPVRDPPRGGRRRLGAVVAYE